MVNCPLLVLNDLDYFLVRLLLNVSNGGLVVCFLWSLQSCGCVSGSGFDPGLGQFIPTWDAKSFFFSTGCGFNVCRQVEYDIRYHFQTISQNFFIDFFLLGGIVDNSED